MKEEPKWTRVLWKKQPFPDNYVGDSFLRVSKKRKELSLFEACYGALSVTQEICSCLGLVVIFFGISEGHLNSAYVLAMTAGMGVCGYCFTRTKLSASVWFDLKVVCFCVVLIACASPIIKSLTGSVATDSINASTTFLLLLRLAVHDYGTEVAMIRQVAPATRIVGAPLPASTPDCLVPIQPSEQGRLPGSEPHVRIAGDDVHGLCRVNPTVSHNVGLFASICLASRLESNLDVFTLMTVAVALFTLLPSFRRHYQNQLGKWWHIIATVVVVALTALGIVLFAPHLLLLLLFALFVCNIFVPTLYISLQGYKQNIYGPWDEAQIEDR